MTDTSAPMDIGIAARDDSVGSKEDGEGKTSDSAVQAVYKGTGRGNWNLRQRTNWRYAGGQGGKAFR